MQMSTEKWEILGKKHYENWDSVPTTILCTHDSWKLG